jgi:hypothetical protein
MTARSHTRSRRREARRNRARRTEPTSATRKRDPHATRDRWARFFDELDHQEDDNR